MTAVTDAPPAVVIEPGVYDLDEPSYLAHPALSSSGARRLLPPGSPAHYRHDIDHATASTPAQEFGSVVHTRLLGRGREVVVVDADSWRTKAAQAEAQEARNRGAAPALAADYERAGRVAQAVRDHDLAGALFDPTAGRAEPTLIWEDQATGVALRCRPDWLPEPRGGRLLLPDLKTIREVDDDTIAKHMGEYGYVRQGCWYLDGLAALNLAADAAWLLVFVRSDPPHLVRVVGIDAEDARRARDLNRKAIDLYAHCSATGTWPGPGSGGVDYISVPAWRAYQEEQVLA